MSPKINKTSVALAALITGAFVPAALAAPAPVAQRDPTNTWPAPGEGGILPVITTLSAPQATATPALDELHRCNIVCASILGDYAFNECLSKCATSRPKEESRAEDSPIVNKRIIDPDSEDVAMPRIPPMIQLKNGTAIIFDAAEPMREHLENCFRECRAIFKTVSGFITCMDDCMALLLENFDEVSAQEHQFEEGVERRSIEDDSKHMDYTNCHVSCSYLGREGDRGFNSCVNTCKRNPKRAIDEEVDSASPKADINEYSKTAPIENEINTAHLPPTTTEGAPFPHIRYPEVTIEKSSNKTAVLEDCKAVCRTPGSTICSAVWRDQNICMEHCLRDSTMYLTTCKPGLAALEAEIAAGVEN